MEPLKVVTISVDELRQIIREVLRETITCQQGGKGEEELLTVDELSKRLGYSKQWVYNNKALLQPEYIKGKPLYRLSKVMALLRHKEQPEPSKIRVSTFKQQT